MIQKVATNNTIRKKQIIFSFGSGLKPPVYIEISHAFLIIDDTSGL